MCIGIRLFPPDLQSSLASVKISGFLPIHSQETKNGETVVGIFGGKWYEQMQILEAEIIASLPRFPFCKRGGRHHVNDSNWASEVDVWGPRPWQSWAGLACLPSAFCSMRKIIYIFFLRKNMPDFASFPDAHPLFCQTLTHMESTPSSVWGWRGGHSFCGTVRKWWLFVGTGGERGQQEDDQGPLHPCEKTPSNSNGRLCKKAANTHKLVKMKLWWRERL